MAFQRCSSMGHSAICVLFYCNDLLSFRGFLVIVQTFHCQQIAYWVFHFVTVTVLGNIFRFHNKFSSGIHLLYSLVFGHSGNAIYHWLVIQLGILFEMLPAVVRAYFFLRRRRSNCHELFAFACWLLVNLSTVGAALLLVMRWNTQSWHCQFVLLSNVIRKQRIYTIDQSVLFRHMRQSDCLFICMR